LIPSFDPSDGASYDENGDIILPGKAPGAEFRFPADPMWTGGKPFDLFADMEILQELEDDSEEIIETELVEEDEETESSLSENAWMENDEPIALPYEKRKPLPVDPDEEIRAILETVEGTNPSSPAMQRNTTENVLEVRNSTRSLVHEGIEQYRVSFLSATPVVHAIQKNVKHSLGKARSFLAQPVWVPTRKKGIKEYSRGVLFGLDVVRFGGTFAGIFVALFVSLNYQSFWEITTAKMGDMWPSVTTQTPTPLGPSGGSIGGAKDPSGSQLLAMLPSVGPPDNRLVIPKLHLNVPLVAPSMNALLNQDWDQVEKDIQSALEAGVVHYPGTARPGQAGNFFVTGHSSYYPWAAGAYKTVFARLHDLNPGDEYWVYFNGDRHRYVIQSKKEVSPSDISVLDQPTDKRLATLMTCTPIGTTLRRLIIVAQEVDIESGIALKVGEKGVEERSKVLMEALPI